MILFQCLHLRQHSPSLSVQDFTLEPCTHLTLACILKLINISSHHRRQASPRRTSNTKYTATAALWSPHRHTYRNENSMQRAHGRRALPPAYSQSIPVALHALPWPRSPNLAQISQVAPHQSGPHGSKLTTLLAQTYTRTAMGASTGMRSARRSPTGTCRQRRTRSTPSSQRAT